MQQTETRAVEIRGLHHSYGANEAVRGLDLVVEQGQCHGFFGRNGAGKTTTIKCLLNQLRPKQGTVRLLGAWNDAIALSNWTAPSAAWPTRDLASTEDASNWVNLVACASASS